MSTISLALFKAHINSDDLVDPDALGGLAAGTDELLQHYLDAAEAQAVATLGKSLADMSPVPADIKHAILQLAAHHYANREAVVVGAGVTDLPYGVADILRAHRVEVTGYVRP